MNPTPELPVAPLQESVPEPKASVMGPPEQDLSAVLEPGLEFPSSDQVQALFWRAGRLLLAGLPAVRSTQRSSDSERSLETLGSYLEDEGPLGSFWMAEITEQLQQPYTGQDEIWSACARAMGRLGRVEYSSLISAGLDSASRPGRVEAAREALHLLYGVWFQSEAELAPYLMASPQVVRTKQVREQHRLLLQRALGNERIARERLLELFDLRPALAIEWVGTMDPAIRIAAAHSLGNALNGGGTDELDREGLLSTLFARLDVERDPRAFHALVSALGQLTEAQSLDAPEVVRLRQALIGQRAGVNTLARAQAMARMPWRLEGEVGEDHIYRAVLDLGGLIRSQAESDLRRGSPDPDPMIETLVALQILCDRASAAGLADGLRMLEVRGELLQLVSGRYYSDVVRVAATDALDAFMLPEDWGVLKSVLEEENGLAGLRYGVLGLLHALLLKLESGTEGARAVIELVVLESGVPDPDLRRRAIAILGDPALKPLIVSLDAHFLVRRFVDEDVSDLALSVIGLLTEFGEESMLADCMASQSFETLAADPLSLPALVRMCAQLAQDDPEVTLAAARRLAGARTQSASLGRLQQALALMASLDDAAAAQLSAEGHRQVCAWSWELQVLGVSLATTHKLSFIQRLARTHWPRSGPDVDQSNLDYLFDEAARKHLLAMLLGIEAMALASDDADREAAIVSATQAYASATKTAAEHLGHAFGSGLLLEVRRDRARFLHASNQWRESLEQFSLLVASGALALPDLRTAMEIMTSIDDGSSRADISGALFQLQRSAILHPTWPAEPLALRMQDLRELSTSAMEDAGGANSEIFVAMLEGMPELQSLDLEPLGVGADAEQGSTERALEDQEPVASAAPVWKDLVLDQGRKEELHELRQRHLDAMARREAKPKEASANKG